MPNRWRQSLDHRKGHSPNVACLIFSWVRLGEGPCQLSAGGVGGAHPTHGHNGTEGHGSGAYGRGQRLNGSFPEEYGGCGTGGGGEGGSGSPVAGRGPSGWVEAGRGGGAKGSADDRITCHSLGAANHPRRKQTQERHRQQHRGRQPATNTVLLARCGGTNPRAWAAQETA